MPLFRSSTPVPPHAAAPQPPSALDLLRALMDDVPRLIGERVTLFTLELQRAKQALIVIVALAAVAALLLLTAWFVAWGAIIAALIQAGLAWGWSVLIVLAVHIGGAFFALRYALSMTRFLSLPATVRHLTPRTRSPGKAGETPFTNPGLGAQAATPTPSTDASRAAAP